MSVYVRCDLGEYKDFFNSMKEANSRFKQDLGVWLEGIGSEFLKEVEEQIIQRNVMDTRLLLHSFTRGDSNGVWELDLGALKLEVGTNLEYAIWANNGHHQQPGRYIPGYWKNDKFVYDRSAKTGMVLKAEWVPGKHYFDAAIKLIAPVFEKSFERNLNKWIDDYFEE